MQIPEKGTYSVIHSHTDLSNGVTNIDSVTKYNEYVDYIKNNSKETGINNICFTEHGSIFEWYKKKTYLEENNMKYVHSIEAYVTENLEDKKRDNYHVCLYAVNFDGFKELNTLVSNAFNRKDGHFYYTPRITFEELKNTSENILISTACLGGILNKGEDDIKHEFIDFLKNNKNRCYLEIQHHKVSSQIKYNKYLYELHKEIGVPLIVGTDTHALDKRHLKGRGILQKAKKIFFDNEDGWDLSLKTYDEIIDCFEFQNVIPNNCIIEALENTNRLIDRVEEFSLDKSYKYPKLCENPKQELLNKIKEGIVKRGINKYPNFKSEYIPRIKYEMETYEANGAFDFLLLDEDIKNYSRSKDIFPGASRGSVSGSVVAYLIGITDVDSVKRNLSFERFMNLERVSLADIDSDYPPNRIEEVKDYIYNKEELYCADIITFNTVALKGSIRDVGRALDMNLNEVGEICDNIEMHEQKYRNLYPELFEYVDIINGTIVSIGSHPCGLCVSPIPLDENMGLCFLSTNEHPVSMISMKSIDAQNYVKLDLLRLDNIQMINETCKSVGIERLTPENVPDEEEVWLSMAEDNSLIFQWESDSAGDFLKRLLSKSTLDKIRKVNPNFKYKDLVSMGNGAIRPAGSSYRDALANGEFRDNGNEALNKFLSDTMGYLVYQEQIIFFLNKFCGYTMGEADVVRRGFAKKTGTEQFIPKIKSGFIKTMKEKYNVEEKESLELIENFLQVIIDASSYLFSLNHSEPYTYIGYIGAWLRYHYPLEYLTSGLNINKDNSEKTNSVVKYCENHGIKLNPPKFRYSRAEYMFNKETNIIYKGIASIKYLNETVSNEMYELRDKQFDTFTELIRTLMIETSINFRQLKILTKLNYFSEFGKNRKLTEIIDNYEKRLKNKSLKEKTVNTRMLEIIELEKSIENKSLNIKEQIEAEVEFVGSAITHKESLPESVYCVTEIKNQYLKLYQIKTGKTFNYRVKRSDLNKNILFDLYNIIKVNGIKKQNKKKKDGDRWITLQNEFNIYISSWDVLL